jgi:hypothetical protein
LFSKDDYSPLTGVQADDAWAIAKTIIDEENCILEEFDYGRGTMKAGYVTFNDFLIKMRAKLLFKFKNNVLDADLVEMESKEDDSWRKDAGAIFKGPKKIRLRIGKRMKEINSDPALLNTCREKVFSQVELHYMFLKNATELAAERWIEKFMKGKIFEWTVTFDNIEKNKNSRYKKFKFEESYFYGGKGAMEAEDSLLDRLSFNNFYINIYTNSDKNVLMQKDSKVKIAGTCMAVTHGTDSFFVEIVE